MQKQNSQPVRDVFCPRCRADAYTVEDTSTGLLRCTYCRNTWVDTAFRQISETQAYLEEQAKRPRVIIDNTTETDEKLMEAVSSAATGHIPGIAKTIIGIVIAVMIMIVVSGIITFALPFLLLFFL
jgi:ribosomal protein L37AE/L43A